MARFVLEPQPLLVTELLYETVCLVQNTLFLASCTHWLGLWAYRPLMIA
nr:MAG TPA: hypothetical protein [Caudoviricetes sp.]